MFRSITELVLPSQCSRFKRSMPQMCGKLTGEFVGSVFWNTMFLAVTKASTRPGPGVDRVGDAADLPREAEPADQEPDDYWCRTRRAYCVSAAACRACGSSRNTLGGAVARSPRTPVTSLRRRVPMRLARLGIGPLGEGSAIASRNALLVLLLDCIGKPALEGVGGFLDFDGLERYTCGLIGLRARRRRRGWTGIRRRDAGRATGGPRTPGTPPTWWTGSSSTASAPRRTHGRTP